MFHLKITIILLAFVLILAIALPNVLAQERCSDYCSRGVFYSDGTYNVRASECEYAQTSYCSQGCDNNGQACVPSPSREISQLPERIPRQVPEVPPIQFMREQFFPDSDGDGVDDNKDLCPDTAGEGGCPGCQIDTDGKDIYEAGKVGVFQAKKQMNPQFYLDKAGQPVGSPEITTVSYSFIAEDTCQGSSVIEYFCDVDQKSCMTKNSVMFLADMAKLPNDQYEELKNSACVLDPFSTNKGTVKSTTKTCICGCEDGACIPEKDNDKDNTPDCVDNDDDNDNVPDIKDNCPLNSNPTQTDADNDGVGNVCDNCKTKKNSDQKDKDYDGSGDVCDNCVSKGNADQNDVNNDKIGDACDCRDAFQGPNENGADCGGICSNTCYEAECKADPNWCGNKIVPIRIVGKPNKGFIDVVFVPDYNYVSTNPFINQAYDSVRRAFAEMENKSIVPFPNNYFEKFNFYYYVGGPLDGKKKNYAADALNECAGTPPQTVAGFGGKDIPFRDTLVILSPTSQGGCSKLGTGINSHMQLQPLVPNVMMHEGTHGIFSVLDEYCGNTSYGVLNKEPNIWSSQAACTAAATSHKWTAGNCNTICPGFGTQWTISNGNPPSVYYRYDTDVGNPDMMTACTSGCNANYRFKEADVARISYVLNNWPSNETEAILVRLHFDHDQVTYRGIEMIGAHPDLGMENPDFMVEEYSENGQLVLRYPIADPRRNFYEHGMDHLYNAFEDVTDFSLVVPLDLNVNIVKLTKDGQEIIRVDVAAEFEKLCNQEPASMGCVREEVVPEVPEAPKPGVIGTFFTSVKNWIVQLFS